MKGKITITKEKFVEIIASIKKQAEFDEKYCDSLAEVLHPHIEMYDNSAILDTLIKLLEQAFEDTDKWIDYFCWELDFGEAYSVGTASRKDKTNIDLSSAATLYDFLTEIYFYEGDNVFEIKNSLSEELEVIVQKGDTVYVVSKDKNITKHKAKELTSFENERR